MDKKKKHKKKHTKKKKKKHKKKKHTKKKKFSHRPFGGSKHGKRHQSDHELKSAVHKLVHHERAEEEEDVPTMLKGIKTLDSHQKKDARHRHRHGDDIITPDQIKKHAALEKTETTKKAVQTTTKKTTKKRTHKAFL